MSEQELGEQNENEPDGKEPVDFDGLDPKYEARFNRIYGHMKENERINAQLIQDNKKLLQAVQEVKSTQIQDSQSQRLESIRAEKTAAYEDGNFEKVAQLDEEMIALRTEVPEKTVELETEEPLPESGLSPEAEEKLSIWAREVDGEGNFVRPWTNPSHPKFAEATNIGQAVMNDPTFNDTDDILAEIDKRMKATMPKKNTAPAVLGNDDNARPAGEKTKLSNDQKAISHVMFPKLSPKEAEEKYAKSMAGLGG